MTVFAKDFFTLTEQDPLDLLQDPVWSALHLLEGWFESIRLFEQKIVIPPTVFLEKPDQIAIGEGTILEPGVFIQGPCILGKRCIVRHGAYLRGAVFCGDDCVIGHGSEIKKSILLNGCHVAHLGYVGDSILGMNDF